MRKFCWILFAVAVIAVILFGPPRFKKFCAEKDRASIALANR